MNFAGFNVSKNCACISSCHGGRFIRADQRDISRTTFAPGDQRTRAVANCVSLVRFDGDDCCFFLALHGASERSWATSPASVKIRPVLIPPSPLLRIFSVQVGESFSEDRSENL